MWWRLLATGFVGGSVYGGERYAAVMWSDVSADVWLAIFIGCGVAAVVMLHGKYVAALLSGKHPIAGVLHYRRKRAEEIVRRVLKEKSDAQVRRIAEATALQYIEDPDERERMAEKLSDKWEKERMGAPAASDDERPQ